MTAPPPARQRRTTTATATTATTAHPPARCGPVTVTSVDWPSRDDALLRIVEQTVFAPVRHGDVVAEAVARLGQAIGMGLLRPGDRLPPEARLADALAISPASLRSALTILRGGGLLETRRGRGGGTVVTDPPAPAPVAGTLPSATELADLADYRCVVEGGAAALAARRASPTQITRLRDVAQEMTTLPDFRSWSEQDTLLHLLIADASRSSRLMVEVGRLRTEVFRISQLVPAGRAVTEFTDREHQSLITAIACGEPDTARTSMIRHVESTRALWLGLGRVPPTGSDD
jgi:GntR family transcriptional regulator, transcriptional repressor for pyruvate dehydrogenase complex